MEILGCYLLHKVMERRPAFLKKEGMVFVADTAENQGTEEVEINIAEGADASDVQASGEEASESLDTGDTDDTAETYQPNLKYKVLDQEHDFDEWAKSVVKDAETENNLRQLYTKAFGLEQIKSERNQLREKFTEAQNYVENQILPMATEFQRVSQIRQQALQSGDLGSFFHAANVPLENVVKWAAHYVSQLEKNPGYGTQLQNQYYGQSRLSQLENENSSLQQQYAAAVAQQKQIELDYTLREPSVSEFQRSFDERHGPGAFKNRVVMEGDMIWRTQGKNATAQEVISQLMSLAGGNPANSGQGPIPGTGMGPNTHSPQAGAVQGSGGKPVLPNIKGSGQSPTKKVISSIDDLRARARELEQ